MAKSGTKSHPMHKKQAIGRRFYYGSRSWRVYWRIQGILLELGFKYERRN